MGSAETHGKWTLARELLTGFTGFYLGSPNKCNFIPFLTEVLGDIGEYSFTRFAVSGAGLSLAVRNTLLYGNTSSCAGNRGAPWLPAEIGPWRSCSGSCLCRHVWVTHWHPLGQPSWCVGRRANLPACGRLGPLAHPVGVVLLPALSSFLPQNWAGLEPWCSHSWAGPWYLPLTHRSCFPVRERERSGS